MSKNISMVCSILLLILSMSLGPAGCGGGVSAEEITSNAIINISEITTLKYEASISMNMEVTGGSDPGKMTMSGDSVCSLDLTAREIQMSINGKVAFPGSDSDMDFEEDMYVVDGWLYTRMSIPGEGDYWMKQELPDETFTSKNSLFQHFEFLETALDVTTVGSEKVDGVDCYIIQVIPDMAVLGEWVQSQQEDTGLDLENVYLSKLFKSFSVKEWIARDKYLPVKAEINVSLEMRPQDMGETPESANMDKMTLNISEQVKYYDYGKPFTIQLPPEAQNAEELPSEY